MYRQKTDKQLFFKELFFRVPLFFLKDFQIDFFNVTKLVAKTILNIISELFTTRDI